MPQFFAARMALSLLPVVSVLLLGAFFVLSGVGKLLDVEAFAWVLRDYAHALPFGLGESPSGLFASAFQLGAPFVPVLEILLGLVLMMGVDNRRYAALALVALLVFTVLAGLAYVHAEAHTSAAVSGAVSGAMSGAVSGAMPDCGCFGRFSTMPVFSFLKTTLLGAILRNLVLMMLAGIILVVAPDGIAPSEVSPLALWQRRAMLVLTVVLCVAAGVSYRTPLLPFQPLLGQPISQTPLHKWLVADSLASDSVSNSAKSIPRDSSATTLIVIFSPECRHCWDATANVQAAHERGSFAVKGFVSRAAANSVVTNSIADYQQRFGTTFPIQHVPPDVLSPLVRSLPTALLVRDGVVVRVFEREIPSPQTIERMERMESMERVERSK
jgi:uncharacterized membrane protein YphA (DoxX/SURF4 family)